jgi:hypothetical protein
MSIHKFKEATVYSGTNMLDNGYLQIPTVKEEIRRYNSQYSAGPVHTKTTW